MTLDFTGLRNLRNKPNTKPKESKANTQIDPRSPSMEIKGQGNIFDEFDAERKEIKQREKNVDKENLKFAEAEKIKSKILGDLKNGKTYKTILFKAIDYISLVTGDKTFKSQAMEIIGQEKKENPDNLQDKIVKIVEGISKLRKRLDDDLSAGEREKIRKEISKREKELIRIDQKYQN